MSNRYLEKIALLNPVAKKFALRVAGAVSGDTAKINNMYNASTAVVKKTKSLGFTAAEKTGIASKLKSEADKVVGPGKLYPFEASRAARAGARLARMKNM